MIAYPLLALLAALLLAALPVWPWSRKWSFTGAAGIAALLLGVFALLSERVL